MKRNQKIVIIGLLVAAILAYIFIPQVNHAVKGSVKVLTQADINKVVEYIRSYGSLAAVVSFCLMILQSVAAPIPAFLITLANATIFGWVKGAMLSWASAMAGAAVCFYIAKALGRGAVEKLTSKGAVESVDVFFERYGKYAVLVCRLLPFVSFDFVSYGAGLTNMSFASFMIATGIGQLPATLVYSYVGGNLTGGAKKLFIGLLVLFALSVLVFLAKKVYNDKYSKKKNTEKSGAVADK